MSLWCHCGGAQVPARCPASRERSCQSVPRRHCIGSVAASVCPPPPGWCCGSSFNIAARLTFPCATVLAAASAHHQAEHVRGCGRHFPHQGGCCPPGCSYASSCSHAHPLGELMRRCAQGVDFDEGGILLVSDMIRTGLGIDVSVLMGANVANEVRVHAPVAWRVVPGAGLIACARLRRTISRRPQSALAVQKSASYGRTCFTAPRSTSQVC